MLNYLTEALPPRPLGLTRILVGLAAAIRALVAIPILWDLTRPTILKVPNFDWFVQPSQPVVIVILATWFLSAMLFAIGWKVPVSGVALGAAIAATLAIDAQAYSNHLYLMLWLVLLLIMADAGAGLARFGTERPVLRWPLLLIMSQLSTVYVFAALTKLNDAFLSGEVLAGVLRDGPIPFSDALRTPTILSAVAGLVVIVELFVGLGLWVTNLRPYAIVTGFLLHLSILLLMAPTGELLVFGIEMLAIYPLFLDTERLKLVWDDGCDSCRAWVARFMKLDVLDVLIPIGASERGHEFSRDEITQSMHLSHLNRTMRGFDAVTQTLEHLVPTLWVAPLLRLPGIRHLAGAWYRRHARRRSCSIG